MHERLTISTFVMQGNDAIALKLKGMNTKFELFDEVYAACADALKHPIDAKKLDAAIDDFATLRMALDSLIPILNEARCEFEKDPNFNYFNNERIAALESLSRPKCADEQRKA